MTVFLVHHSDAVGPLVDPQRPLSAIGRAQAQWLADHAKARGAVPAAIWHSGKLRARQTAEVMLHVCNPFAVFRMAHGLRPEDRTTWIEDALRLEEEDVMVVSHMPLLPALAQKLGAVEPFPINGMIGFDRLDDGRYVERWRSQPPVA